MHRTTTSLLPLAFASYALVCRCATGPTLRFNIKRPDVRDEMRAGLPVDDAGDLQHPLILETDGSDGSPEGSTAEGILLTADLADLQWALPDDRPHALFLSLFTLSYASPFKDVEQWLTDTGVAPPHAPLRLTALFDSFSATLDPKGLERDEHGDSCIGFILKGELCLQAMSCVPVHPEQLAARPSLDVWVPVPVATNYRLEAYLAADDCTGVLEAPLATVHGIATGARRMRRLADAPKDAFQGDFLLVPRVALASGYHRFRVLYVDEPTAWWAGAQSLVPLQNWMEMMGSALIAADPWLQNRNTLYLEFGVASGRSLAFISARLQKHSHITIHAFDSFQGIPQGWHRYTAQSFGMQGQPPEFISSLKNVKVHIGYFTETLRDLDEYRSQPVAFVHIDSDLFASAREVLSYLRCQLVPGTVIVFDEWFNYAGWQKEGEYRAWRLFAENYGVRWRPLGFFFEQAAPIMVESVPEGCYVDA